jgi:glycosyltransferase involved in cell wall biosynthesis
MQLETRKTSVIETSTIIPPKNGGEDVGACLEAVCSQRNVGRFEVPVDPFDVEAIADGIRRVVHVSNLRAELRQKGLLRAKEFSWEETAHRTRKVLDMAAAAN